MLGWDKAKEFRLRTLALDLIPVASIGQDDMTVLMDQEPTSTSIESREILP